MTIWEDGDDIDLDLVLPAGTTVHVDNTPYSGFQRVLVYDKPDSESIYYVDLEGLSKMLGRPVTQAEAHENANLIAKGPL